MGKGRHLEWSKVIADPDDAIVDDQTMLVNDVDDHVNAYNIDNEFDAQSNENELSKTNFSSILDFSVGSLNSLSTTIADS